MNMTITECASILRDLDRGNEVVLMMGSESVEWTKDFLNGLKVDFTVVEHVTVVTIKISI